MRPYLAIIKDSFREALASRVLWVLLALITVTLISFAPLTYREHVTVDLGSDDVEDWPAFIEALQAASNDSAPQPARRIWTLLDSEGQQAIVAYKGIPERPTMRDVRDLHAVERKIRASLNKALRRPEFKDGDSWKGVGASLELRQLQQKPQAELTEQDRQRLHRLLLEAAFPDHIAASPSTSFQIRYAVWDFSSPFPTTKKQFTENVFLQLPFVIDKFVLSIGLLIAVLVTAPIIPQMFDPSSLHLLLSKPITRPLLYLSRFVGGCAFVFLAASYLFLGLWLIAGIQWGIWEPQLLWCIPVYVFVFATYFSVSALAGAIWRNTIVAVIVAIVFWATCFSVGTANSKLGAVISRYRIARVVPAENTVFGVDEMQTLLVWDEGERQWKTRVISNEHEQARAVLLAMAVVTERMPPLPALVGPAYDARQQQLVAAAPSFKMLGRMVMVSARETAKWKPTEGAPPSGQPIAILVEPDGHPLLITSTGMFRVMRDVSTEAVMLRLPGISIPLTPAEALQDVGPLTALRWSQPAAAAIDARSGRVFVYSRGQLTALALRPDGRYRVEAEERLLTQEREPALLAAGGDRCYAALRDGKIIALDASTLGKKSEIELPSDSSPRSLAVTPDDRLLVLDHGGTLHSLGPMDKHFAQPRLRGQGDISALTVTPAGELYLASRATRVIEFDASTLTEKRQYNAVMNFQEKAYYYAIRPMYAALPKPGEFYKTVQYLLTRQQTVGDDDENLETIQAKIDPWSPIWSGLLFQAIMLTLGCFYIHWQDF